METDLGDLEAFCRAVDTGSLTAAARAVGETKGSVSRRVARLEKSLGVALFTRTARGMVPTESARAYRQRVGVALELLQGAECALRDDLRSPSGHLRVTAPPDIATAFLAPILGEFREAYPGVTLELLLTDRRLSIADHEADVALRAAVRLDDSALVAHKLFPLDWALVASPAYVAAHGTPATPDALAEHPIVLLRAAGEALDIGLRGPDGTVSPVRLAPAITAGDGMFLLEVVAGGAGVAALPAFIVAPYLRDGRLVRVLPDHRPDLRAHLWLVSAAGPLMPPKVRVFRDFVKRAARRCSSPADVLGDDRAREDEVGGEAHDVELDA